MDLQDQTEQSRQVQCQSAVGATRFTSLESPTLISGKHLADHQRLLREHLAPRYRVSCGDTLVGAVIVVDRLGPYGPDFARGAALERQFRDRIAQKRRSTERLSGAASRDAKEPDLGSLIRRSRWPSPVPTMTSPGPWLVKMIPGCRTKCCPISS